MISLRESVSQALKAASDDKKVIILCSVFSLSVFFLSRYYPLLTDSAIHIIRSQFILENNWFPYIQYGFDQSNAYVYPPLFHILGAFSKLLTGFYTVLPAFSGALSIYLTYKLVELWYDEETGILSAVGVAVTPFFFLWSSRMYIESTITAAFLLTFYLYFRYIELSDRRFLYVAFAFGGFLAALKTYGPLTVVIMSIHFALTRIDFGSFREAYDDCLEAVWNLWKPLSLAFLFSLPWPVRNILKTGSPVPKLTGVPYSFTPETVSVEGLSLVLPTVSELANFPAQALGIIPTSLVADLSKIHPLLPLLWYLLPLSLTAVLIYGARYERDNLFIWIWAASILLVYEIGRFMSEGAFSFKYRHFVTLTPVLGLFAARAYQKMPVRDNYKRAAALGIIAVLFAQMFGAAAIRINYAETAWNPVIDWTENNVGEEEVIFSPYMRPFAYQLDGEYKVIDRSYRPNYINPEANFSEEIRKKADWVMIGGDGTNTSVEEKVYRAQKEGVLVLEKEIDATKNTFYGELGRKWYIFRVKK